MKKPKNVKARAQGAALLVGVVMLIILSLFVLGAMRDVLLQERMSGAFRNGSLAYAGAQSMAKDGQRQVLTAIIAGNGVPPDFGSALGNERTANVAGDNFRRYSGYPTSGNATPQTLISGTGGDALAGSGSIFIEGPAVIRTRENTKDGISGNAKSFVYDLYRVTGRAVGPTAEFSRSTETHYVVARTK